MKLLFNNPKAMSTSLLTTLEERFNAHMHRHKKVKWSQVQECIEKDKAVLKTLQAMEDSGGEPDVVVLDPREKTLTFVDCAKESPKGRRSCCYDQEALKARKKNPPKHSAMNMAKDMGVTLLTEVEYYALQELEDFDTTTSSWIATPSNIREKGGALFGDRRYDAVFTYHNGADSYYAARGFRGKLVIA